MPAFSVRCRTAPSRAAAASASASSPVPSGEPSSTISTRKPSGAARASTSPAAATIAPTFSASLYVGSISQGSPDIGRRTLDSRRHGAIAAYPGAGGVAQRRALKRHRSPTPLEELGDLYELDGAIVHRVVAYRTAAKAVREATVSVAALAARGARHRAARGSARRCRRRSSPSLETGTIPAAERCGRSSRRAWSRLTRLPGLGPKRARLLYYELGIDSPEALREAALAQRLRAREGARPEVRGALLAALADEQPRRPARARSGSSSDAGARRWARSWRPALQRARRARARTCSSPARCAGRPTASRTSTSSPPRTRPTPLASSLGRARADRERELGRQRRARRARTHSGIARRPADRRPRAARQPAPALHRLGRPQRGAAGAGGAPRPARVRVRHPRRRHRRDATTCATEQEVYELLGLAYIEPELRENRGELEAALAGDAAGS